MVSHTQKHVPWHWATGSLAFLCQHSLSQISQGASSLSFTCVWCVCVRFWFSSLRRWRSKPDDIKKMSSLTTATQRGAEKKLSELAGRRCYDYPGVGYHNVPDESTSINLIREFCREHFPETLPPMGPGLTDKAARHLSFIAGVTDNPSAIPPERHSLPSSNWSGIPGSRACTSTSSSTRES